MRKAFTILVALFLMMELVCADGSTYLNFTAVNGPATISLDSLGTPCAVSLQYSTDNCGTWNAYSIGQEIQLTDGAKVYFKATSTNANLNKTFDWYNHSDCYEFSMSGDISADGNIMSLLDADMQRNDVPEKCFVRLFAGCSSLTQAPELPATQLADSCYADMFWYCSSLIQAPALPATTLAKSCYASMFCSCTTLKQAVLPATTLADNCYENMFSCCTLLTNAPALPATTLANHCYVEMFDCCIALTQAPALPATNLAEGCYYTMFEGCTSLRSIPELPATNLKKECYLGMFLGCTSLKVNVSAPGEVWKIPEEAVAPSATDWNRQMFDYTGGTFTGDPVVGVEYYVEGGVVSEVDNVTESYEVIVAPNPVKVGETVYVEAGMDVRMVEVYNADGKLVNRIETQGNRIEVSGLNVAGVYIVRVVRLNGEVVTRKIIVE